MRKRIRLTESDLRRIVNKSVKRVINEVIVNSFNEENYPQGDGIIRGDYRLGQWMPTDKEEQMEWDWQDIDDYYLNQKDFDSVDEHPDRHFLLPQENENIYDYDPNRYDTDVYWDEYSHHTDD